MPSQLMKTRPISSCPTDDIAEQWVDRYLQLKAKNQI